MLSWSSRRDDEPDHPDQPYIVAVVGIDPANPSAVSVARVALHPVPYARPDELQDDVIEPTAVFKPWLPYTDWDKCIIDVEIVNDEW
jgi:hypothetical protein